MMQDAILSFAKQFSFKPVIQNKQNLTQKKQFIVLGMGGSHLAADVLLAHTPSLPLLVHSDYGLPPLSQTELKNTLIIASSFSGNTEEVVDGLRLALHKKLSVAVLSVGGTLQTIAERRKLPFIQLPNTGIQPRSALGFNTLALLKLMNQSTLVKEAAALSKHLDPKKFQSVGEALAKKIKGKVPVIYTSRRNSAVGYNWKIKLNETGKIPAFYNVFPELNHNEMTGFDVQPTSKHLSESFYFLFLKDSSDHLQIQKRMHVMEKLYKRRGLTTHALELTGKTGFEKIFSSLLVADWTAVSVAAIYGLESEQVPMVEEFKKMIT